MIIKSMSRKTPSFGQLLAYIDREMGQEGYAIRHNLFGRDHGSIRAEFERNAELLGKRKNGVYLFHEILSITRAQGLSAEEQKERLYEIAQEYIAARSPDNLVYGGLHQDKEHSYHIHFMISANRAGETKRQRLSKHQFRDIQVKLEAHVLQKYPELKQKLAIGKRSERGRTKQEAELERRTGERPKRDEILERVQSAYDNSQDRESLLSALGRENLELYVRGKTLGVIDHETGKKHRLKTLDLEMADRVELRLSKAEPENDKTRDEEREQKSDKQTSHEINKQKSAGEKEKGYDETKTEAQPEKERKGMTKDYSRSSPIEPDAKRRERIDKGYDRPDPNKDLLDLEEWKKQDKFTTKMQQSWRRTMDDFRGRNLDDLENDRGKDSKDDDREL